MEQLMPNWLKQRAELTPDRLAIKTENIELSFKQLHERAVLLAHQLSYSGVKKHQHIGILMKNSVDMVETIFAVLSIGAVAVMLNTRLTEQELAWQVEDAEAAYLICDRELHDKISAKQDVKLLINEELKQVKIRRKAFISFDEDVATTQVATIMYTSGTTGNPKGVMQSYGNHWSSAIGSALNLGLRAEDRWLLAVPLFHISGLSILMRSVIYGMGIVLFERFDAKKMNAAIIHDHVTIVSVVTTMLQQMLEKLDKQQFPPSFRCMLAGGGPVPKSILEECQTLRIPVYQTYGMTETASQIVTLSPEYSMKKLGSAGKPLFSCQIKIVKDGKECGALEEGEIVVKGPNITKGYWKREDATIKAIKDGWLHTGDQGYMDDEGFLYVLDRRSDLIISGGENVYPAEIESILLSHPKIKDAGVIGVENQKWGQTPYAFVSSDDEALSIPELLEYCKSRLAPYKVPTGITILQELPRNASNKLLRRKLKEQVNQQGIRQ
ncbi:O-succinylbenzoic acid--CoA ligase [Bacillus sp. SA1-12]|uniref:o-succinylbenzoate--CoA ligase n=1 Tax=Bacillus sp. SA1-12 TaxID=1455638 RepID=UPI000627407D|nr:o-succinylbenzoate--CoA ligase [Bacillus sp. SA1-12]KKI88886.1 O-succinylbenzoic acid--CoA ligase [Bacillus sp. SA1-12]